MTIEEMFPFIMIEFEKVHARLDKLESPVKEVVIEPFAIRTSEAGKYMSYEEVIKALQKLDPQPLPKVWYDSKTQSIGSDQQCFWVNLSPEDRMKPMGLSCPCKRCSPMSCSSGVAPGVDKLN